MTTANHIATHLLEDAAESAKDFIMRKFRNKDWKSVLLRRGYVGDSYLSKRYSAAGMRVSVSVRKSVDDVGLSKILLTWNFTMGSLSHRDLRWWALETETAGVISKLEKLLSKDLGVYDLWHSVKQEFRAGSVN